MFHDRRSSESQNFKPCLCAAPCEEEGDFNRRKVLFQNNAYRIKGNKKYKTETYGKPLLSEATLERGNRNCKVYPAGLFKLVKKKKKEDICLEL